MTVEIDCQFEKMVIETRSTSSKSESDPVSSPILEIFNSPESVNICSKEDLRKHFKNPAGIEDVLLALFCMSKQQREKEILLENRVVSLTSEVNRLTTDLEKVEDRLLRSEAYQGRNTVLLDGVPDSTNETQKQLETKVVSTLKIADPTIRPEHLGIVHRNRARTDGSRTVTVVFNRARQKDTVMRKQARTKMKRMNCSGTCPPVCSQHRGVASFHRLSPALADRKKEIENLPNVEWVAFSGHRLFTVCYDKKKFKHNVLRASDLEMD